ncbi:MAG: TolC family outer membrane protein [Gammaproteobacteria bacterium]|nr:TolC family outer membrane protein [Gammaproteobacteria bacterium]
MILKILVGIWVFGSTCMSYAAEDLLQAYAAALTNDPRFGNAHYEYEAAKEAIPQARADLLPNVSIDARRAQTRQNIIRREQAIFGGLGLTEFPTTSWSVQASQPVFRMSSWVRLGQAKATVRRAFALYTAAEQDLIGRTAESYIVVLATLDSLDFSLAEQAAVGRQLELVQARRRGGLANITDEYEAQARFSRVEADVIQATYTLDDAYQGLREVVGDAVTSVMRFRESFPLVPPEPMHVETWIDRALENNLTLMAANEAVNVAQKEVERIRANHYPSLELVARHGNIDSGGAITGGATDVDTTEVSLQLNVPIYTGGAVRSRTREAEQAYQGALEERKLQHRVVMRETRSAFQTIRGAISRIEALGASLRAQESVLLGKTEGYRSGVNTLLDVLDAERDLYSTKREHAAARFEYLLNLLRLKQQVGALSEEDLAYINRFLDAS